MKRGDPYGRTDQKDRMKKKVHEITSSDISPYWGRLFHVPGISIDVLFSSHKYMKKYTDFCTSITGLSHLAI